MNIDAPKAQSSRKKALLFLASGVILGVITLVVWAYESWIMRKYLEPDPVELFASFVAEDVYLFTGIPCRVIALDKRLPVNFLQGRQPVSKISGIRGFEVIFHLPSKTLTAVAYGDSHGLMNYEGHPPSGRTVKTYGTWPEQACSVISHRTWIYSLYHLENLRWEFQEKPQVFIIVLFRSIHNTFSIWTGGGKPHQHFDPMSALRAKASRGVYWYSTVMIFFIWTGFLLVLIGGGWLGVLYQRIQSAKFANTSGLCDDDPDFSFSEFLFSPNLSDTVRRWREAVIRVRTSKLEAIETERTRRKRNARLTQAQVSVTNNALSSASSPETRRFWFQDKIKLFLEKWESASAPDSKAWELYQKALAMDMESEWREKRHLIKAAIRILTQVQDDKTWPTAPQIFPNRGIIIPPVVRISLAERIDAEFPNLTPWIRPGIDPEMVRAILITFLNLGRLGSRTFQNTYFSEIKLQNSVIRRYEVRNGLGSYDPASFKSALSWLVSTGVVLGHAKSETGFCLCAHERRAREQGVQILKAVKDFTYRFTRLYAISAIVNK